MTKYLQERRAIPGPLFCHYCGQPLTRYQFSADSPKPLTFWILITDVLILIPATTLDQEGLQNKQCKSRAGDTHSQ